MKLLATIYRLSDNLPLARGVLDTSNRHIGSFSMLTRDVPAWARSTIRTTIRRGYFIAKNHDPSMISITTNRWVISDYCSITFEPTVENVDIIIKPSQLPRAPRAGTGVVRQKLSTLLEEDV